MATNLDILSISRRIKMTLGIADIVLYTLAGVGIVQLIRLGRNIIRMIIINRHSRR